jgi:adenine/guanine phosphoribosyltransferase-like PRPP-binding protein
MSHTWLEQFQDLVVSALPQADTVLLSGVLGRQLAPEMVMATIEALQKTLPEADVILAAPTDDPILIFELSRCLNIPFVGAQILDVVETDDSDSNGFLQDELLLQVQISGATYAIAKGAIAENSRVLIFRDVLSEGIMTLGLLHLTQYSGASAVGVAVLVEKGYLSGRSRIAMAVDGIEVWSLLNLARINDQVVLEKRHVD